MYTHKLLICINIELKMFFALIILKVTVLVEAPFFFHVHKIYKVLKNLIFVKRVLKQF